MRKLLTIAMLAAGTLVYASAAQAVPIAAGSELSLDGSDTFTATSITFIGPANIGGESGSFSVLPNCTDCVTMTSFTSATANFELYTATEGAITTTLTTTGLPTFSFTPGSPLESLAVTGTGVLTLTGFDPTPGAYDLTTQGPGGTVQVTFSSTSVAVEVPEPGTLALLGTALAGLALLFLTRQRRGSVTPFAAP